MSSQIRKRAIKALLVICTLFAVPMAINWFMTYKLEDSLRKRLSAEVAKATDGFYNFSFDELEVGLFSGELMLKGLSFTPDSAVFVERQSRDSLPSTYFNIHVDTIDFKGINLTWLFNYRQLGFDRFIVNGSNIKIISPHQINDSLAVDTTANRSLYERISPYFDIIQARHIDLQRANVEYIVEDSLTSHYKLEDFKFTAFKFVLDKNSENKEHLLFSENFQFNTNKPQVVLDSEHFLLNIGQIRLSTLDSIVHIGGVHLEPKEKYWDERFVRPGSCVETKVADVLLDGISFSRKGTANFLDARNFTIRKPNIEYYSVAKENNEKKRKEEETEKTSMWSLYSITSPIFEQIKIENINVEGAKLQYAYTKKDKTDLHTLNKLDFFAHSFLLNSMSHQFNFFLYAEDFSINAENIKSHMPSKNGSIDVERLYTSSIERSLKITNAQITPLTTNINDNYVRGSIDEIEITELHYKEGVDADMIKILSPQVDIILGKQDKKKEKTEVKKTGIANALDVISPYINHVAVKDIKIKDGRVSLINKKDGNKYQLNNLDFYAKNFYLDKETRRLRDYFFRWDEYSLKFRDFDNLTPDQRYRVQIKEGDFNSVTGDMLLRDLRVKPEKDITGSYISIVTPYASLLGLNERAIRKRQVSFKTFILDSPVIEVVKDMDQATPKVEKEIKSAALQLISFDLLTIPSPSLYLYDVAKESSLQVQSIQVHVDSFRWELNEILKIDNLIVESPFVSLVEGKEIAKKSEKKNNIDIASFGDIDIRKLNIRQPILKIKKPNSYLDISADSYLMRDLFWSQKTKSVLQIEELDLSHPTVFYAKEGGKKGTNKKLTREELLKNISTYANDTKLGRINISDLNLRHFNTLGDGTKSENNLTNTHLLLEDVNANWKNRKLNVGEIAFRTSDINYPIMDSFYTLRVSDIDFSIKRAVLDIKNIHLDPNYPKFDFAYKHPRGKDWFNLRIDSINLSGINTKKLFSDTLLLVDKLKVNHVLLENLKNQKIEIEHNIMPLLYQEFQRLPLKYNINDIDIRDFTVIYEELSKNGHHPSRIPFSKMNGRIKDFTNIQKGDNSFYSLHVDGLAMGTAPFLVEWKIPVDSTNDKFYLSAEIRDMDMRDFNQLIRPMAPAYVHSGRMHKLAFQTEATSLGAVVDMEFAYDSLYFVLLKNMDSDDRNKLMTYVINKWGIESRNLGKDIRLSHDTIVRDPYHSNFNYFWQIIQPPLIKSVGITEEKQNLAHNLATIFKRIKRFFGGGKKEEKKK